MRTSIYVLFGVVAVIGVTLGTAYVQSLFAPVCQPGEVLMRREFACVPGHR